MKPERMERLKVVNELIALIVETDSDRHNPTLGTKTDDGKLVSSSFAFKENGLLYFIDSYTEEYVRPLNHLNWEGFSSGGTMRELVKGLAAFIMTGKQGFLNDYKEIWGWKYENILVIRNKAFEIGFISTVDYPYERWG